MNDNPNIDAPCEKPGISKLQDDRDSSVKLPPIAENNNKTKKKPAIRHAEKRRTSTCRFADRVAQLSVDHYKATIPIEQRPPQTCIATILAHYRDTTECKDDEKNQGLLWVLSMGVGTKFLSESSLRQELENQTQEGYGSRVRDMHAEVLARRAFRRQLTLEIQEDLRRLDEEDTEGRLDTISGRDRPKSILVRCQTEGSTFRYRLRPGVTLHMYTSSAPCGNATLKKFCKMSKEKFREDLGLDEWPDAPHEPPPGHSIKLGEFSLLVKKNNANLIEQNKIDDGMSMDANSSSDGNKRKNEEKASSTVAAERIDESSDPVITKKTRNQKEGESNKKLQASQPQKSNQRRGKPWPATLSDDWAPPGTTIVGFQHKGSLHTCSDKICRWNYLGFQGSLLAGILEEPLYISTLTVGRKLSGAVCRRAICCRLDTRCRQPRFSDKDSSTGGSDEDIGKYRVNHPAVLGTSVYMDDGVVDTSNTDERGQDVRFHSSVVWTWWKGLPYDNAVERDKKENGVIECIESSSGLLATLEDSGDKHEAFTQEIRSTAPKVSTKELISLFLQVYRRVLSPRNPAIDSSKCEMGGNNGNQTNLTFDGTLSGIREIKKQCSPKHERFKDLLLTEHRVLSQWRRRDNVGKYSYCPAIS